MSTYAHIISQEDLTGMLYIYDLYNVSMIYIYVIKSPVKIWALAVLKHKRVVAQF